MAKKFGQVRWFTAVAALVVSVNVSPFDSAILLAMSSDSGYSDGSTGSCSDSGIVASHLRSDSGRPIALSQDWSGLNERSDSGRRV